MSEQHQEIQVLSRRRFLQLTGITGAGIILGVSTSCSKSQSALKDGSFAPNSFVNISPDDTITIYIHKPEMGQGINTAFAMIIAEEMDANWHNVKVKAAPIAPELYGSQEAVASRSLLISWKLLRQAGATARSMLLAAAADELGVAKKDLEIRNGWIIEKITNRKRSFGQLALAAAQQRQPFKYFLELKDPSAYRLIGSSKTTIDAPAIVTGQQKFAIDHNLPNMCYAVYAKSPKRGASLVSANIDEIKDLPDVLDAFQIQGNKRREGLNPGVAIIASNSWAAMQAKQALVTQWADDGANDSWSNSYNRAMALAESDGPAIVSRRGGIAQLPNQTMKPVTATYHYNFIAHAQLEPLSCTAWLRDDHLELWCASQSPEEARQQAAELLSLNSNQVTFNQLRGGGAFGRRLYYDFVLEAAAIAAKVDRPVKLIRSREDDMQSDLQRGGGFHHFSATLGNNKQIQTWRDHFVSFTNNKSSPARGCNITAEEFPLPFIENTNVTQSLLNWQTPIGFCRAPGSNVLAFAVQSFLSELSANNEIDHLEFLLELMEQTPHTETLGSFDTSRASSVLKRVAKLGGWNTPVTPGQGLGLAFHYSHGGYFAELAKVTVGQDRKLSVDEVNVVGDVGIIVNQSGAAAQCEGSIMDGLSVLLAQKVTLEDGVCQQSNFHQYPVLRMNQAPKINVQFVDSPDAPTGLGEPALPPLAPAVGNAIYAASGHRVRTLPFSDEGYYS